MRQTKYIVLIILITFFSCKRNAENFVNIGDKCFSNNQYNMAIDYFTKAIQIDEKNVYAIHSIGRCHEELGSYEKAIEFYTMAIDRDSLYALAYRSRGYAEYKLNDYENALKDYQKSMKIEPENSTAYSNSGSICEKLCKFELAREYYYKALELNPEHYGVMSSLANIEFDLENYDACIRLCYKTIGNLDTNADSPYLTLGLAYTAIEKYDSAVVQLTKALKYGDNCHAYNNRGYAYSYLDKYQDAISDFNQAIKLDSLIPSFYLNRADVYYGLKLFEKAISDYDKSIEISKLYEGIHTGIIFNNRANARLELGDVKGYEEDIKEAKRQGYPEKYKRFSNLESCFYNQ